MAAGRPRRGADWGGGVVGKRALRAACLEGEVKPLGGDCEVAEAGRVCEVHNVEPGLRRIKRDGRCRAREVRWVRGGGEPQMKGDGRAGL